MNLKKALRLKSANKRVTVSREERQAVAPTNLGTHLYVY